MKDTAWTVKIPICTRKKDVYVALITTKKRANKVKKVLGRVNREKQVLTAVLKRLTRAQRRVVEKYLNAEELGLAYFTAVVRYFARRGCEFHEIHKMVEKELR